MTVIPLDPLRTPYPPFEGQEVHALTHVVSGRLELDDDTPLSIDDRLVAKVEMRVVGVRHIVDAQGQLVRQQILKPILGYIGRFDDDDPTDTGIIRATR